MPVKNRIAELQPEIAGWRRDFHENPELLYEVQRTAGVVADRLREFGVDEIVEQVGRTGVVGVIRGRQNGSGRVIGLRADMDALPILEASGKPWASKTPGVMHACGHDGHTAMLLGAAKYLAETRNFDGTVVLLFQPAEEGGAGAKAMMDDGALDKWGVQEVYGMHNWPGVPAGQFAIRSGPFFAATYNFTIDLLGRGGHAAKPNLTIDPTVMGAQVVLAMQSITARNIDPLESVVVSITSFQTASTAYNVIPPSVQLRGTVRVLQRANGELAGQRIKAIAEGTAAAYGGSARVEYVEGYPVMANHADATDYARAVAAEVSGLAVPEIEPTMGGEDFAYMLQARPGAYILIGNGDTAGVHTPDYDFDDGIIPNGSSWYVGMAESRMPVA